MSCQPLVRNLLAPLLHFANFEGVCIEVSQKRPAAKVIHRQSFGRSEQPISKVGPPRSLITRIILVVLQPSIMDRGSHLVSFDRGQSLGSSAQIGPPQLNFSEGFSVPTLSFDGVSRLQTPLLLALADKGAQVFWHAPSEPVSSSRSTPDATWNAGASASYLLATFRRKIEALGCCRSIAQGVENCKVGQI
jgi:hypothetical protein